MCFKFCLIANCLAYLRAISTSLLIGKFAHSTPLSGCTLLVIIIGKYPDTLYFTLTGKIRVSYKDFNLVNYEDILGMQGFLDLIELIFLLAIIELSLSIRSTFVGPFSIAIFYFIMSYTCFFLSSFLFTSIYDSSSSKAF